MELEEPMRAEACTLRCRPQASKQTRDCCFDSPKEYYAVTQSVTASLSLWCALLECSCYGISTFHCSQRQCTGESNALRSPRGTCAQGRHKHHHSRVRSLLPSPSVCSQRATAHSLHLRRRRRRRRSPGECRRGATRERSVIHITV